MLQHDSTDCGAACLASVIRYYGGDLGIETIRRLSGTTQSGTTMLGLYQAAVANGLEATGYEASIKDIIAFEGILILHVTIEKGYEHYVVNYGFNDEMFVIWDPASGFTNKTITEIEKIWVSHKCLAVSPGNTFKYQSVEKKEKRKERAHRDEYRDEHLKCNLLCLHQSRTDTVMQLVLVDDQYAVIAGLLVERAGERRQSLRDSIHRVAAQQRTAVHGDEQHDDLDSETKTTQRRENFIQHVRHPHSWWFQLLLHLRLDRLSPC